MKLYYAPDFSSLADHIALIEAGVSFELVKVDLETKQIEGGGDYFAVNPKGYVPALVFDNGEVLTENTAILTWITDQSPHLHPAGSLGRYRLIEMLSFIASEIHKRFPIYLSASEDTKTVLHDDILRMFEVTAECLKGRYLLGDVVSVADFYLFVMVRGAKELEFPLPPPLEQFLYRVSEHSSVKQALDREAENSTSGAQTSTE